MLGPLGGASLAEALAMNVVTRGLVVALVFLTGCDLYFNDDDPPCAYAYDVAYPEHLRNPQTGECQVSGGGCDSACGPCAKAPEVGAQLDWGTCFSDCEQLDESACITASGCRAAYTNSPGGNDGPAAFRGCWAVAPSGPVQGSCEGLDAQECSRHDDCSAYYNEGGFARTSQAPSAEFAFCAVEQGGGQGCYSDQECGDNAHCSTSDGDCQLPPGCDGDQACPAVCYGRCVLDNDTCTNVDCGPGSHCEQQCTPCDPSNPNEACDPGCGPVCVPDQACAKTTCPTGFECIEKCDDTHPTNPGCGVCTVTCEPINGVTCEGLTDAQCASREDCRAVYQGMDCTCYPNTSCECEILTYERCEARP